MQSLDHDEVSTYIDAQPDEVYALVADVTRTPEFSPEILECVWLDGATGPGVGVRFEATNKVSRGPSWKNRPVVVAAEPGASSPSRGPRRCPAPSSGDTGSHRRAAALG